MRIQASILIEPYIAYKAYTATEQTISNNVTKWSSSGPALGARVGYSFLGLMAGVDYSVAQFELKRQTTVLLNTQATKDDYQSKTFGLFVGYEFPILLRVWGTYFLSSEYEDTDGPNRAERFSGSGFGLGAGYTAIPFLSLNLEIRNFELDTFKDLNSKRSLPSNEIPNPLEILFSISLPLHF